VGTRREFPLWKSQMRLHATATSPVLKDYLNSIPIADQQKIGALTMNSIPYDGTNMKCHHQQNSTLDTKHPSTDKSKTMVFIFDGTKISEPSPEYARWKNIVKPWNVDYHYVHYIKEGKPQVSGNPQIHFESTTSSLRITRCFSRAKVLVSWLSICTCMTPLETGSWKH
jgi:hypothetical protein